MKKIIDRLNRVGNNYIDSTFNLSPKEALTYVINGKNISTARNKKKNISQPVNVLKWFDDFWLYLEIRFLLSKSGNKKKKTIPNIFFTLSVFQGKAEEDKIQLFRAEWDNYEDLSDMHPQPHWHIYTQREIEDPSESFDATEENFKGFIKGDIQTVSIDKFHFAMNGQWSNNNSDVHRVEIESDLINWFEGVLNHLKKELEYISVK